ncbi:hypothetical protein [Desulfuromonas acetoxidans]|uniref:Uncharacterized protein n=1 Tax=Desulfuromonas acetoxidans (strain DSM 684 / 11070) TaxID=281689 RepID=Q1JWD5_DESA6|nr:hypothetical protein [Desulfuromonas acetoxidans]EAT14548.1 conserved hypothetical protein [Desulfuromonas acetoxidans DSM 684]MBF0645619.1 hypothetical protein [Desulfuromonas acetoxidans]NVD24330.1 hypothetical protein [Desulfuromonas acetoxidans]NVE14897.1 hypothetical protein [Desulfuromonas acetoxidans]
MKKFAVSLGVIGLVLNLVGGVSALFGVYLIAFKAGVEMFGWGNAKTFGYLFLCVGLCLVAGGVLLASYVRNR